MTGFLLTIVLFWLLNKLYIRSNRFTLLQPVISVSCALVIIMLVFDWSYQDYFSSAALLDYLMGPTLALLAIPVYRELRAIQSELGTLSLCVCLGGLMATGLALIIVLLIGTDEAIFGALYTKSVTTPIAIHIAEQIGSIAALSACLVIITGAIGAVIAPLIFKAFRINDDAVQGMVLGTVAHAIGTVRALEISPRAAAYAVVSMGINGLFTAILLPILMFI